MACRLKTCEICLDRKRKGLSCSKHHFICCSCITRFFTFHCQEKGLLFTPHFKLPCALPNCKSKPWRSTQIVAVVDAAALSVCIDATPTRKQKRRANKRLTSAVTLTRAERACEGILDVLNVRCPSPECRHVLDPSPDGCCAMTCPYCRLHFCWICFYSSSSASVCHIHVGRCPYVPLKERGNLFVTNRTRNAAHRIHRIQAVRETLWQHYGLEGSHGSGNPECGSNRASFTEPSFYERCFLYGAPGCVGGEGGGLPLHPEIEEMFCCCLNKGGLEEASTLEQAQVGAKVSDGVDGSPAPVHGHSHNCSNSVVEALRRCDITVQDIFYERLEEHLLMHQMSRQAVEPPPTFFHICCHNTRCVCAGILLVALLGGFVTAWVAIIAQTYEFVCIAKKAL